MTLARHVLAGHADLDLVTLPISEHGWPCKVNQPGQMDPIEEGSGGSVGRAEIALIGLLGQGCVVACMCVKVSFVSALGICSNRSFPQSHPRLCSP
jgi:hypothetical protein